jgi:nitroimidazol reductase NimA-like FMN-containing flavoprotein (pyridoxamine 5'-phosphate oxidase superfamily)
MSFHRQWVDSEITDDQMNKRIIMKASHLTLALSDGSGAYAVPISHVYDTEKNVVYFHCASIGKKMEILRKNPHVWCLAVIDKGSGQGICQNLYASVMFSGVVAFPENVEEKVSALRKQIEANGVQVEESLKRLDYIANNGEMLKKTVIGRIPVENITGKRSTSLTEKMLNDLLDNR